MTGANWAREEINKPAHLMGRLLCCNLYPSHLDGPFYIFFWVCLVEEK